MLASHKRTFLFAALACGALLAACDDAPPAPSTNGTAAARKPVPKVAGLAPEMVAAVSPGRNSTVVSVHFALRDTPAVSQALPVDIAIVPHQEFTFLRAHFEGYEGMPLTTGENLEAVTGVSIEKPIKHQLILLPAREGVFIVTASVETEGIDGNVTRIFSIPVIVGPVNPPPAATKPPASPPPP